MSIRRSGVHRLLVHLAAGARARALLGELDEELRTIIAPTHAPRHAAAWYRAECGSLACAYLILRAQRLRFRRRTAHTPLSLIAWFPSYRWQLVFVPIYGLLGAVATWFLWVALRGNRLRWAPVGAFVCWVAAVFLDFVEGLDAHHPWHPYTALARAIDMRRFTVRTFDKQPFDALMHFSRAAEESLETLGVALFGAAVIWLALGQLDRRYFRLVRWRSHT